MGLDRRRQDVDVMERVLGGVRDDEDAPHTDLVRLDVVPWIGGFTTSVVQLTVLPEADQWGQSRHDER